MQKNLIHNRTIQKSYTYTNTHLTISTKKQEKTTYKENNNKNTQCHTQHPDKQINMRDKHTNKHTHERQNPETDTQTNKHTQERQNPEIKKNNTQTNTHHKQTPKKKKIHLFKYKGFGS